MIKSTCEKIIIPVSRNTKMEIPILKINRKKTVPKRLMVFVMGKILGYRLCILADVYKRQGG